MSRFTTARPTSRSTRPGAPRTTAPAKERVGRAAHLLLLGHHRPPPATTTFGVARALWRRRPGVRARPAGGWSRIKRAAKIERDINQPAIAGCVLILLIFSKYNQLILIHITISLLVFAVSVATTTRNNLLACFLLRCRTSRYCICCLLGL